MKKAIFAVYFLSSIANAGLFGPNNYDECVIAESKEIGGPIPTPVMRAIHNACLRDFPKAKPFTSFERRACSPPDAWGKTAREWAKTITSRNFKFLPQPIRESKWETFYSRINEIKEGDYNALSVVKKDTYPPRYIECD